MNFKKGKLTTVAKTGGIKLDNGIWLNPADSNKTNILQQLDQIQSWRGKFVVVEMETETSYVGIAPEDEVKRVTQTEEIKEVKTTDIKKHIINIKGKEFITFEGLLDIAHQKGLKSIETEMIEGTSYIFKSKVTMKDGSFYTAYGDANVNNVGDMIKPHIIRMAETRSIARALRLSTNVGMCSLEELDKNE
jgi:hypothetical protein